MATDIYGKGLSIGESYMLIDKSTPPVQLTGYGDYGILIFHDGKKSFSIKPHDLMENYYIIPKPVPRNTYKPGYGGRRKIRKETRKTRASRRNRRKHTRKH